MNIHNVYIGNIDIVKNKDVNEYLDTIIYSKMVRLTLLLKKKKHYIDLLTNHKYKIDDDLELLDPGDEFINFKTGVIPLVDLIKDKEEKEKLYYHPNRTKRKILSLYRENKKVEKR